jgi:Mg2+ and Co2+ transporter CorA
LQELTSDQQYQINQFPRKRQLRDIHALQEELSVVQSVNSWQQQSFEKFRRVLDPKSFSDLVPQSRISMFPPEAECLDAGLKTLQSKATELDALEQRTQYLRQQLKQSVEILEADHGKAILVFTMITTIFLPLYVFRAK